MSNKRTQNFRLAAAAAAGLALVLSACHHSAGSMASSTPATSAASALTADLSSPALISGAVPSDLSGLSPSTSAQGSAAASSGAVPSSGGPGPSAGTSTSVTSSALPSPLTARTRQSAPAHPGGTTTPGSTTRGAAAPPTTTSSGQTQRVAPPPTGTTWTPPNSPAGPTSAPGQVTYATFTRTVALPQPAGQQINDASLAAGQTRTVQQGHAGQIQITYRQEYVGGAATGAPVEASRQTIQAARPTITAVGTAQTLTYQSYTRTQSIGQPADQQVNDSSMYVGQSQVVQQGHPGSQTITYRQKYINGSASGGPVQVSSQVTQSAQPTIIHIGTKQQPSASWQRDSGLASSTVGAVNSWRRSHGLKALSSGGGCPSSDALSYAQSEGGSGGCGLDAYGYTSGSGAVDAWAGDPGHRAALASPDYTAIGCTAYSKSDGSGASVSCALG